MLRGEPGIGYDGATSWPLRPLSYTEKDVTKLAVLELKNLHVALEDGTEIVKGVDLCREARTRCTRSWARTGPGSRRSRTR